MLLTCVEVNGYVSSSELQLLHQVDPFVRMTYDTFEASCSGCVAVLQLGKEKGTPRGVPRHIKVMTTICNGDYQPFS